MTSYAVTDPTTNRVIERYPSATEEEIDIAIQKSAAAYHPWRELPMVDRSRLLRVVARRYREDSARLADIITTEMGKTTSEALGEIELSARIYDYYADNGEAFMADRELPAASGEALVRTEPIGVLVGIMPWNYPYYQVARFAAPNLALGNTILLKHAPSCPRSARAIADIFESAGFPEGSYVNVYATEAQVKRIIEHPAVQGVSLTGSERAGRAVGEIAGRSMKKMVLELGGSDPFIVLADADLEAAVDAAVAGRMGNAGQACTASKRFIVVAEVYDAFLTSFVSKVQALRIGDPHEEGVAFGPLSSEAAAVRIAEQIEIAVADGATVLTGGRRADLPGAFVEPTVLTDVNENSRVFREEIFGPVAVVHRVEDQDAAVRLANDSPYGLGSVVFTSDATTARMVAEQLDVGMVSINAPSMTQEDLPFGGVKGSGVGRELGEFGMAEFVNRKLIRRAVLG